MITVLMATWQGRNFLEQQLDSILSQTVPVRIWISDDGSTDGTKELLEQYQQWYPKQVFLYPRENSGENGASGNFFWLLSLAAKDGTSDYVMLSDQDDVWCNHKVKTMVRRMKQLEQGLGEKCPILVHSDMEVTDSELNLIDESFFHYAHLNLTRNTFAEVLVENPVTGGAMMINRSLLNLVAKEPSSCFMHDWWIALTASCFGVIDFVPEALSKYRQHSGNLLGARASGSLSDCKQRLYRQKEVEDNYRKMMDQAHAFGKMFWKKLDGPHRMILRAYLALPYQSLAGRCQNVVHNRFFKSSGIQTAAMCVTMPHAGEKKEKKK